MALERPDGGAVLDDAVARQQALLSPSCRRRGSWGCGWTPGWPGTLRAVSPVLDQLAELGFYLSARTGADSRAPRAKHREVIST